MHIFWRVQTPMSEGNPMLTLPHDPLQTPRVNYSTVWATLNKGCCALLRVCAHLAPGLPRVSLGCCCQYMNFSNTSQQDVVHLQWWERWQPRP